MISQTIRTSKYTTTIDIPAEKLHTKAKFIQIEKNPYQREEIISIPNPCYGKEQEKKQMNLETKLMIEELEQAYNEDVSALENKISSMKTNHDIESLKYENEISGLKKENAIYKKSLEQFEEKMEKTERNFNNKVEDLEKIIKSKDQELFIKQNEVEKIKNMIEKLTSEIKEKDSLLSSKFREFETEKDIKFQNERKSFEVKIEAIRRENEETKLSLQKELNKAQNECDNRGMKIQNLERELTINRSEITELKKLNDFQNKEIESYIKNLKDLEEQKKKLESTTILLHEKIEEQNHEIERLIEEMREQRIFIETNVHNDRSLNNDNHSEEEIKMLTEKVHEYAAVLEQRDKENLESKTQYLLKLKEIDEEKQLNKNLQLEITEANGKIASLNSEIKTLKDHLEQLKNELTKKILEYNELLNKPPEHFEVKIEKSIDKKEYITELELKIEELEAIIDQLKVENESYIEEIRRKVKDEQTLKMKEQQLMRSNEELKSYISNREKSIGWAVEREIMKDVEISRNGSEKSHGYRVFVKNSSSRSEKGQYNDDVSGINMGEGINFSVESKLEQILEKKQLSSAIQMSLNQSD